MGLLDKCERSYRSEIVHKLAAIPRESISSILINRGLPVGDLTEITSLLTATGSPFTAEQVVEYSFTRHLDRQQPFGFGRFGDGTEYPVYYSAIEKDTCIREVAHHARKSFSRDVPYPRYYRFIKSMFDGFVFGLCGQEELHPYLISEDEAGYPFCWDLAKKARTEVSAFFAPSARNTGGICVPVFVRNALTNHQLNSLIIFSTSNGEIGVHRSDEP